MSNRASEISSIIRERIEQFDVTPQVKTLGTVVNVKDGIVQIHGLSDVMFGEMILI